MNDAGMAPKHTAIDMNNLAGERRAGLHSLDDIAISASWHKANVLAVGFIGNKQPKLTGDGPHTGFFHVAEGKPKQFKLCFCYREQEIALVARKVTRPIEGAPAGRIEAG
jgi:hypothetical protein